MSHAVQCANAFSAFAEQAALAHRREAQARAEMEAEFNRRFPCWQSDLMAAKKGPLWIWDYSHWRQAASCLKGES